MQIKPLINHQNARAYALGELLDIIYKKAYDAGNMPGSDHQSIMWEIQQLLHGARELSAGLIDGTNDLFVQYVKDSKPKDDQAAAPTISLDQLELSSYTYRILKNLGVSTVGQLLEMSELDLLTLSGVGRDTIANIKARLAANGLSLARVGE